MLSAAITNLGQYNEGCLNFVWLPLPASESEFESALSRVGIGDVDEFGNVYEEYFVSDYDNETGLDVYAVLGEYPSLQKMNDCAEAAEELSECDDPSSLVAFCDEHNLNAGEYGIDDIFEGDSEVLHEIVKEEAAQSLDRLICFLRGAVDGVGVCDYYRLNGYGNLVPVVDFKKDLRDIRQRLLADVVNG